MGLSGGNLQSEGDWILASRNSGNWSIRIRSHVDYIAPARLIRRLKFGNPDQLENLHCICGTRHGYRLQGDCRLCLSDKLGYLEIRSQNELIGFGFAKDYDAVLTVHTEPGERCFVHECERSPSQWLISGRPGLVESRAACESSAPPSLQL